jgi:hypothetical protein
MRCRAGAVLLAEALLVDRHNRPYRHSRPLSDVQGLPPSAMALHRSPGVQFFNGYLAAFVQAASPPRVLTRP